MRVYLSLLLKLWNLQSQLNPRPAVYFLFPETNGRHLEEVDVIFTQSKSIFDTVSVAKKLPRGRKTRKIDEKNADKSQDSFMDKKREVPEHIVTHDSNVARSRV